jgi:hypothetical protein
LERKIVLPARGAVPVATIVAVTAGSVSVFVPDTLGDDSVIAPLVLPERTIELIVSTTFDQ